MTKEEFRQKITEIIQRDGKIDQVAGMLVYCQAYVESCVRRADGIGWEIKILGIDKKFKGRIDNELIDISTMAKRIFMEWLRFLSAIWFLAPFIWLKRKDLIFSIIHQLRCETFRNAQRRMKWADFSPFCGEILKKAQALTTNADYKEIIWWSVFGLEFDNLYRMIVQDLFGEINFKALEENPLKEIFRVANLAIRRNRGIGGKWTILWTLIKVMALSKGFREKMVGFLKSLDMSKVRMDADDRYWTLRYDVYQFAGRRYEDRFREVLAYDKEVGNWIICDHPEEPKKDIGSHFSNKPVMYK